jgi:hypothetical protein
MTMIMINESGMIEEETVMANFRAIYQYSPGCLIPSEELDSTIRMPLTQTRILTYVINLDCRSQWPDGITHKLSSLA